jgi:hypothetical protein
MRWVWLCSIKAGIAALGDLLGGVMILPADMRILLRI